MELLFQIFCGVVIAQILYYIGSRRKDKTKFEKIDRAVFGEDDISSPGLISKIKAINIKLGDIENLLLSFSNTLESHLQTSGEDSGELNNHRLKIDHINRQFEDLIAKIKSMDARNDRISYSQERIISKIIKEELRPSWIEINKKVNKEAHDLEMEFIKDKLINLGETLKQNNITG